VAEGAQVILGPVFAQEANAAGVAVAASGVNVLSFSNNPLLTFSKIIRVMLMISISSLSSIVSLASE
jgi:hypothetical protein